MTEEEMLEAYGDYRESIGRDRVNTLEELTLSIPFAHFKAGIKIGLSQPQSKVYGKVTVPREYLPSNDEDLL